jgi:hypothetical protein
MRRIVALVILLALCVPAFGQTEMNMPNLVGNWTGTMHSVVWEKNTAWTANNTVFYRPNIEMTMMIKEQNKSMFYGKMIPDKIPRSTQMVLGVLGTDNKTVSIVDEDGYCWGKMLSPTRMELFRQEVDMEGMLVASGIFNKM